MSASEYFSYSFFVKSRVVFLSSKRKMSKDPLSVRKQLFKIKIFSKNHWFLILLTLFFKLKIKKDEV